MTDADGAGPSSVADALLSAARALVPMVANLTAKGDSKSLVTAAQLQRGINRSLDAATKLNADAALRLLSANASAVADLQNLTANAETAAARIAKQEAHVASALTFCASIASFGLAVSTGNLEGAVSSLGGLMKSLQIS